MAFCDFKVKYNPDIDNLEQIRDRVFYSIWIKRIKANKPTVIFIGADSGEGKSMTAARITEILFDISGLTAKGYNIVDYVDAINVFNPIEYAKKLDRILGISEDEEANKRLKKIPFLITHEARELVRSKNWQNFLTQAVADVNALSREIKPLIFFVISQFIRDITADVRYTLNYYCKISRPKGKKARLYINVVWKDDRDLEKPRIRKRRLQGYLIYPDGRERRFIPEYFEMSLPQKAVMEKIQELSRVSKTQLIRRKMNKLISEMEKDADLNISKKIDTMLEYYTKHSADLMKIGKRKGKGWRLTENGRALHDLTTDEARDFETRITEIITQRDKQEAE